jgi:hypothetical protein
MLFSIELVLAALLFLLYSARLLAVVVLLCRRAAGFTSFVMGGNKMFPCFHSCFPLLNLSDVTMSGTRTSLLELFCLLKTMCIVTEMRAPPTLCRTVSRVDFMFLGWE